MRDSEKHERDGIAYLFQALHVFEVESNVKKAEIRIYKLKLQEKEKPSVIKKTIIKTTFRYYLTKSHSQEPFWWWDFSHRHSGVYSFLWDRNHLLTSGFTHK